MEYMAGCTIFFAPGRCTKFRTLFFKWYCTSVSGTYIARFNERQKRMFLYLVLANMMISNNKQIP